MIKKNNGNISNEQQKVEENNELKNNKIENENENIENSTISEDERQKLENFKCVICLERDKNVVFLTCNHMVCCEQCANIVKDCPLCRKNITSRIKVFM